MSLDLDQGSQLVVDDPVGPGVCRPGAALQAARIGYVYPAGGRQGATFQVAVGGQFLDGVTNAYVSGAGVRADGGRVQPAP